jgi:hypothetical protein
MVKERERVRKSYGCREKSVSEGDRRNDGGADGMAFPNQNSRRDGRRIAAAAIPLRSIHRSIRNQSRSSS